MTTDELAWTEAGRAELARALQWDTFYQGGDADEALRGQVARALERFAPAWRAGVDQADAAGRAAVAYTTEAVRGGALPASATVEEAAGALSLFGGYADVIGALLEQLIRARGVGFALAALVRMWSQETTADERTRHSEDGLRVWLTAITDDHRHARSEYAGPGSLGSRGKGKAARYLLRTHQASDATTRAAMRAAVDALWPAAPPQARAPLAVATADGDRAAQVARDALAEIDGIVDDDGNLTGPFPSFELWHLPHLVHDVALVEELLARGSAILDLRILANLGAAALPLFERHLEKYSRSTWRQHVLEQLCNLRGRRTARIMAAYAERRPYGALVHNYFAAAPELLTGLRRVRAVEPHRDKLERLEARLGLIKPRPRTRR